MLKESEKTERLQGRYDDRSGSGHLLIRIRDRVLHVVDYLARRPRLTIVLTGMLGFVGCFLYALLNGIPQPSIHDEFAYLLAGDTFASGGVANPTHPMWKHFESFHILQQPTYASKYPPGQGLFLALGEILGHPILGVWISVALMGAAISWMLFQWVPARWAVLGSLLALVQVGFPTYWAQSYWGGAVAALGGALVYGALRAGAADPRFRHGILFGLGAMILANTRPMEGMLAGLPAALALGWLAVRGVPESRSKLLRRVIAPATLIVLMAVGLTGFYNWKVTGDPTRLPYIVYSEAYHFGALFPWQEPNPVVEYRHKEIGDFKRVWGIERHELQQERFLGYLIFKVLRLALFFLGPGLLALVMTPSMIRDRWLLISGIAIALVMVSVLLTPAAHPHYAAPVTGLLILFVVEGLRRLYLVRTEKIGARGVISPMLILIAYLPYFALRTPRLSGQDARDFAEARHQLLDRLKSTEGDDLVIVRYGDDHNFLREWVYNRAVIDSAAVVWARDMSADENQELIRYFDDRRVWLLEVDGTAKLRPFPDGASSPDPPSSGRPP